MARAKANVRVTVNVGPLRRLKALLSFSKGDTHPRALKMYKRFGVIYRSFAQRRFAAASRGSGAWKPLKNFYRGARDRKAAEARIRKNPKTKPRGSAILRDTNTLYNALNIDGTGPGAIEELAAGGIILGYGGIAMHPNANGGDITIAEIAAIHQFGVPSKNIPARPIIVDPDTNTLRLIEREATAAQQDIINEVSTLQ